MFVSVGVVGVVARTVSVDGRSADVVGGAAGGEGAADVGNSGTAEAAGTDRVPAGSAPCWDSIAAAVRLEARLRQVAVWRSDGGSRRNYASRRTGQRSNANGRARTVSGQGKRQRMRVAVQAYSKVICTSVETDGRKVSTHDMVAAGGMRRARQGNLQNVWQLASSMHARGYKDDLLGTRLLAQWARCHLHAFQDSDGYNNGVQAGQWWWQVDLWTMGGERCHYQGHFPDQSRRRDCMIQEK